MRIRYSIATYNLGDLNTETDNEAYAAAVGTRLEEMYPGADVEVDLTSNGDRDLVDVESDVSDAESDVYAELDVYAESVAIERACREAAQAVWDAADY